MSSAPICLCGNQMVLRKRKVDGREFYGCARFARGGCSDTAPTADESYADDSQDDE